MILLRILMHLPPVLGCVALAAPTPARAVTPPEPAAIERTIPTQAQQTFLSPAASVPVRQENGEASDQRRFTLGAVNIDGATIFSQEQLSRYFEPYLATEVDRATLAQMAKAITARYRQTGYLLSYAMIPQQNVEAGMVRLSVVEGRIGEVRVVGGGTAERAIEAIAEPLVKSGPIRDSELERAVGLIRDIPGITVTDVAVMRSDIEAGLYTLKISVARNRVQAFAYADNRGTGSIGRSRIYNSFAMSSLAVNGDELKLDLFAMPGGRSHYLYGQAAAGVPLTRSGARFQLSASRGDQYLRADERFDGRSDNISAQLSYPFLRSRALSFSGKMSLTDWRTIGTQAHRRLLRDRLRVARLGFEFSKEGKTSLQGEMIFSRGLDFSAMTRAGDPLASRGDASGRFAKAAFTLQAAHQLDDRLTLRAVVMGQYSDRPLLSAEEFSLGGNRLGRAYRFNERTGDRGGGGGLELSYSLGNSKGWSKELFGFVDGGVAVDMKSATTAKKSHSLASAGVGARFSIAGITASAELAVPSAGEHHSPRFFWSIYRSFYSRRH